MCNKFIYELYVVMGVFVRVEVYVFNFDNRYFYWSDGLLVEVRIVLYFN